MKKHIALFLAAALTVSALPMTSVLAKTENSIESVFVVAVDHEFKDVATAPKLIIQNDEHLPIRVGETFRLALEKAEWNVTEAELKNALEALNDDQEYNVTRISKTEVEITLANVVSMMKANPEYDATTNPDVPEKLPATGEYIDDAKFMIRVPMLTEVTEEGDAKVNVISNGSLVTQTPNLIFATVSSGKTKTSVDKTVNISESGTTLNNIVMQETSIGSLNGEKAITMKAPANFDFSTDKVEVRFAGGFSNLNGKYTAKVTGNGTNEIKFTFYTMEDYEEDGQTKQREVEKALPKSTSNGTIIFEGLFITPNDDAKFGDVNITVKGTKASTDIVLVGEYKDYGLTFEAEDKELPVILAGRISGRADNSDATEQDDVATLQMKLKETLPDSLFGKRITKITVPDGVEIRGAEIGYNKSTTSVTLDANKTEDDLAGGNIASGKVVLKDNEIQFRSVETTKDKSAEMYVKLYVSAEAGYTGEIVATLSGGGMSEEMEATVAKVESPVNVTTAQTQLNIGFKDVVVNDITISETQAGAIRKTASVLDKDGKPVTQNAAMTLQIDDGDVIKYHSVDSYEVTDGDISIDRVRVVNGKIQMTLKSESEVPSTIVLKGIKTSIDRTPATGNYDLNLAGSAILNNYEDNSKVNGYFDSEYFTVEKAYRVATQDDKNVYVQLKVDSKEMTVGADTIEMDVAPYINSNGRTMLPIRYVANAFGISQDQINWNPNTKTVTIVSDGKVVQLETGSTIMISNGTRIQMDTAVENKDGRTFIPISWVAVGLGLEKPVWNEAERTVTFNAENAPNA